LGRDYFIASTMSLKVTTLQDFAQISGRCANCLSNVAVAGTITL
jgi:hypothetical protein